MLTMFHRAGLTPKPHSMTLDVLLFNELEFLVIA